VSKKGGGGGGGGGGEALGEDGKLVDNFSHESDVKGSCRDVTSDS